MKDSCCPCRSDRRHGLTLIELVAALVLLSVLMVALTGIIPRFTHRKGDATATSRAMLERTARMCLSLLARDLAAADSATLDQSTLSLRCSLSAESDRAGPAPDDAVRYRWEERADRQCLVRAEQGQSELLCCGGFRLEIQSFADDGTSTPAVALGADAATAPRTDITLASWLELRVRDGLGEPLAETSVIREPASAALLQVYEERR